MRDIDEILSELKKAIEKECTSSKTNSKNIKDTHDELKEKSNTDDTFIKVTTHDIKIQGELPSVLALLNILIETMANELSMPKETFIYMLIK